ncbi:mitochondrial DNA polymerase I protein A, putative [Leishmania tarentolae]|uniref:DNA-directed DNA polymerase n=1 Tax=Leishmania tarentolae TaxID=5689 RepID=A0A640KRJ9_LEITA|nr:mitochondrial DNA polymerase I protein A, putative [Leishmania tarentolae]
MDPFQRTDDVTHHAFRVVPMTHLSPTTAVKPSGSAWSFPDGSASSSPSIGAPPFGGLSLGTPQSHTSAWIQPTFHHLPDSEETARNVQKWRQFGLQIGSTALSKLSRPLEQQKPKQQPRNTTSLCPERRVDKDGVQPLQECHQNRVAAPTVLSHNGPSSTHIHACPIGDASSKEQAAVNSAHHDVVVVISDDDESGANGGSSACQRQTEAPPPRSVEPARIPNPTPATLSKVAPDTSDVVCTNAILRLQVELAKLSEKVQHSTEEKRCGPPKRSGSLSGDCGSPPWAMKHWGGKKRKRDAKTTHNNDSNEETEASVGSKRHETDDVVQDWNASSSSARRKSTARRHSRASTTTAAGAPAAKKKPPRKRGGGDAIHSEALDPSVCVMPAPRTLFSLSSSDAGRRATVELQSGPTASATVSVPYIYLGESAEVLFDDVRRALNDPDRIQAPPLFVGVLIPLGNSSAAALHASAESRTNFTNYSSGAKTAKRRVSCCFSSLDPVRSHQHVELVLIRWEDSMYALPAQTVGLAFLCRILTELPGVELITFNAQVLLVALLAYCKGTLWSNCVSDVRVMAWMAQLHVASTLSKTPSAMTAFAEGGAAAATDEASDANTSVLYDYSQLLLHVCGGKLPPTVQLESMSTTGCFSHSTISFTESTTTAATATPAPLLTSAQRELAHQVYYLATVYRSLYGLLGSKGLLQAFLRQEKRIALLLALLKYNGMPVDLHEVHRYQKNCEAEMARQRQLASKLIPELGDDFNIQSHDQCRKALYEVLQLGQYLLKSGNGEAVGTTGLTITKGGRLSTAEDTLRALARYHEFPACLLRYRKVSKLMQTYVEGMMSYAVVRSSVQVSPTSRLDNVSLGTGISDSMKVWPQTNGRDEGAEAVSPLFMREAVDVSGDTPFVDRCLHTSNNRYSAESMPAQHQRRTDEEENATPVGEVILPARGHATLHPNFLQEGTDTGRLSCVEPNLQNLPRNGITSTAAGNDDKEDAEEDLLGFRRCFVATGGCVLLSIDYEQIELRVLAHLCGDAALVKALTTSTDIHRAIAEVVFKKKPVSTEERSLAKRVVFGVLYGAGPKTLATHMGVTVDRALHITSLLTNAFPGIDAYHRRVIEEARTNGFVRTLSGRLRYLPDIRSTVLSRRSYAERQAFNSVVQGSAADVMKMAMLAVSKDVLQRYDRSSVSLLSQIHDEMVFMVRKELLRTVVPLVSSAMSHAMQLLVPLSVTAKFGDSLGSLHEWSVEHDLGVV